MIEEPGLVVETRPGIAVVETRRRATCDGCSANKGCGTAVLGKVLGNRRNRVEALDETGAAAGDEVMLALSGSALVRGSLAVYLVPLLGLIAGASVGEMLGLRLAGEGELISGLGALLGLALGLAWLRAFTRRIRHDPAYQARVVRKLGASSHTLGMAQAQMAKDR